MDELQLPERYVLFAGAWDVRKNLALLLDAWPRVGSRFRVPLILAGQSWYGSQTAERKVQALRKEGFDVRPLGYQPANVLYELMRRATLFVFPSLYEGFGLPPMEAMRLGTPSIISTAGSLPEVCGDAAVAVSPHDVGELASALNRLLGSPEECAERSRKGKRHAEAFTWARAAKETIALYEQLL
jgi:glycosyltransferase involved in cell wall biosynthesis